MALKLGRHDPRVDLRFFVGYPSQVNGAGPHAADRSALGSPHPGQRLLDASPACRALPL